MGKKNDKDRPPEGDRLDGGRRNFFRMLFNPLTSVMQGYELPANHTSQNPPRNERVIRAGPGNRLILQLIGPLAMGTPAGDGYLLQSVQAAEKDIAYTFTRDGRAVRVRLYALGVVEGSVGDSQTFSALVDGDAPEADCREVAANVVAEVRLRDRGQLWTSTAVSPRPPG